MSLKYLQTSLREAKEHRDILKILSQISLGKISMLFDKCFIDKMSSQAHNLCARMDVGPVTIHTPCANPTCNCPKAPSGPGCAHVGNVPFTNIGIHVRSSRES